VPAALHANFLTSCIGVATALFLWIPIVLLDWTGIEPFRWPGSRGESTLGIWAGLEVVAWGGALYVSGHGLSIASVILGHCRADAAGTRHPVRSQLSVVWISKELSSMGYMVDAQRPFQQVARLFDH
jgi:hypothetical protein